ncbi:phospholipase, patatin family protein [Acanthamoeba castellanii str. Neff]|uniref:Phospholipase, patatin family protein n=1 Tax=Acanthamoeba castellanii (strain ATCC 30010 / Neff) TaxID=1257118 RepID=L8GLN0_ACACF|nr:phospholipase, patatin family protein [Acanthamoeba castellanii str. Neff]ELR13749.1 phospholipase, patatin family protein [Acanthamoeba castellanii str. Neff]
MGEWFDVEGTEMANWEKLELAARAPQQMMAWKQFFTLGETDDGRKEMAGFLWVKQKDVWDRFYCVADRDNFEWLKPGAANLVPLTTLTNLRRGILTEKEQHKLQTKKKKEEWDKSPYLSKIRQSKLKLSLLKQDELLYSFVTPSRDVLVAMATHIIAQKGLNNLVTHNRTLLDEVDSAKAVATNTKYKIKRGTSNLRKRSEARETTLVPIHRRTPSHPEFDPAYNGGVAAPSPASGGMSAPPEVVADRPTANRFLDSVGDDSAPSEHYLRKSTIEETKETTKLRNEMRDVHERAMMEMGKTPLGNTCFTKNKKLGMDAAAADKGELKSNKDFFILSLDGGGLRGIVLTTLLVRLVEIFPDLMERVDLFAGVSAGSIVASALATGRSPVYMQKMLLSLGPLFFMPRNVRQFHGYPLRQAKYSMVNLKIILEESLRGATLDTCPRNLLISSFLLDNHKQGTNRSWSPRVYHNLPKVKKDATTSEEEEEEEDGRGMQAMSEDTVRSPPSGGNNSKNSSADTPAPPESSTLSRRINAKLGRARSENKVGQERRNAAEDMIASAERRQEEDGKEAKGRKRRNVKGKDLPEATRWRADAGGGGAKVEPHREKLESTSSEATETEGHDGPLSEGKAKEASPDKVSDDDVAAAASEVADPSGAQAHVASRPQQPHLRHHRHHSGGSKGTATGSKDVAHLQLQSPRNSAPCGNPRERAATARGPRPAEEAPRGGSLTYRAGTKADDSDADADTEPVSEIRRSGQAPVDAVAGMGSHGRRPTPRTLIKPSSSKGLSGSMHSLHLPRQKSDVSMSNSDLREPSPISDNSAPTRRSAPINNKQSRDNRSPLLKVDSDSLVMDLVLASAAVSNNPSLAAITTVLSPDTVGTPKIPAKVHVLSIGTGYIARFLETNNDHDWGVLQWAPWLSEMMLYTAQLNATQLSATLLGDNFHRLDPQLEEAIAMDNPALLPVLEEKAKEIDLSSTIAWIKRHVYGEKAEEAEAGEEELLPSGEVTRRQLPKRRKKKRPSKRPSRDKDQQQQHHHQRRPHDEDGTSADEVPHNNMHWGTDAWFATQRMWEG